MSLKTAFQPSENSWFAPSDVIEDARHQIVFQAEKETTPTLHERGDHFPPTEASSSAGGLGGGLEEVDKDTVVMYGSIAAAVLFGLIFVVALARTLDAVPMLNPCMSLPLRWRTNPGTRMMVWTCPSWTISSPMMKTTNLMMSSLTFEG